MLGPMYCIMPMVDSFSRLAASANRISGNAVIGPAAINSGMSQPPCPINRPSGCCANQASQPMASGTSTTTSIRKPARLSTAIFFRITP